MRLAMPGFGMSTEVEKFSYDDAVVRKFAFATAIWAWNRTSFSCGRRSLSEGEAWAAAGFLASSATGFSARFGGSAADTGLGS